MDNGNGSHLQQFGLWASWNVPLAGFIYTIVINEKKFETIDFVFILSSLAFFTISVILYRKFKTKI
jgi:hypothetical protein